MFRILGRTRVLGHKLRPKHYILVPGYSCDTGYACDGAVQLCDHILCLLGHIMCAPKFGYIHRGQNNKIVCHLSITLTWRVIPFKQRALTRYKHKFKQIPTWIEFLSIYSNHKPTHQYQHQCRPCYGNIRLSCNMNKFPKPYNSKSYFDQSPPPRKSLLNNDSPTHPQSRHYDALWNNIPASTTSASALTFDRDAAIAKTIFSTHPSSTMPPSHPHLYLCTTPRKPQTWAPHSTL